MTGFLFKTEISVIVRVEQVRQRLAAWVCSWLLCSVQWIQLLQIAAERCVAEFVSFGNAVEMLGCDQWNGLVT
jgi:hypothetical protein